MPSEDKFSRIASMLKELKIELTSEEVAAWSVRNNASEENLDFLASFLSDVEKKKQAAAVESIRRLSRLPKHDEKTFETFDTSQTTVDGIEILKSLKTLAFIEAGKNVILVGNTGNGKTHIAEAIGNKCCEERLTVYFIKGNELKDKIATALRLGTTAKLLKNLSHYVCLIIDELGHDTFNTAETNVLFQIVDMFSSKAKASIVVTTNKDPGEWDEIFESKDSLECLLDRLEDRALCLHFSGNSYRGRERQVIKMSKENVVLSLGN